MNDKELKVGNNITLKNDSMFYPFFIGGINNFNINTISKRSQKMTDKLSKLFPVYINKMNIINQYNISNNIDFSNNKEVKMNIGNHNKEKSKSHGCDKGKFKSESELKLITEMSDKEINIHIKKEIDKLNEYYHNINDSQKELMKHSGIINYFINK